MGQKNSNPIIINVIWVPVVGGVNFSLIICLYSIIRICIVTSSTERVAFFREQIEPTKYFISPP